MKPDNSIRICGDYKTTIKIKHLNLTPTHYLKLMISLLAGGKPFTKMDLSHTYQLVKLDLQSQLYTTINTHKGLGKGFKDNQLSTINISMPDGESPPRTTAGQCVY